MKKSVIVLLVLAGIYFLGVVSFDSFSPKDQVKGALLASGYRLKIKKCSPKADLALYNHLFSKDSIQNKRFYNIGAGKFQHPYWTNIDKGSEYYAPSQTHPFIDHDLFENKPLPLESGMAEVIYSSHLIEHVDDAACDRLFSEIHRTLKEGGVVRLTCPDADLCYQAYESGDKEFFFWVPGRDKMTISQLFLRENFTQLLRKDIEPSFSESDLKELFQSLSFEEAMEYLASKCTVERQLEDIGGHMNWWTRDKLIRKLKEAGFEKISISGFGQSSNPVLRNTHYFDQTHWQHSVYIEAIKQSSHKV